MANALTTPYHLVEVSPARRRVVEIGDILLGRPGEDTQGIIIWQPVSDRMTWWDSAEAVPRFRAQADPSHGWELETLRTVLRQVLPQITFTNQQTGERRRP